MKFVIKHEMRGRLRIHFCRKRLTFTRADELAAVLAGLPGVSSAKIYERTADAVIWYSGGRRDILERISRISEQDVPPAGVIADGRTRELNAEFKEKLICRALIHFGKKSFSRPLRVPRGPCLLLSAISGADFRCSDEDG